MKWLNENLTLFFDYDGTLHDCLRIYAPAFRSACRMLSQRGLIRPQKYSDAEISRWLGYTTEEMWNTFQPALDPVYRRQAAALIGREMQHLTESGCARLYPSTEETLDRLHRKDIRLVFLSNCSGSYMELHRQVFGLDQFFDGFHCIDEYPVSAKYELYEKIREQYPGTHIIIGDRMHDFEIGERFHLLTIGCSFGYGTREELSHAGIQISSIRDLLYLFRE